MKAKTYLMQIDKINRLIENKLQEAEYWKNVAAGGTSGGEGERVQSSSRKDKMAEAVCRYIALEEEINAEIDKLCDVRQEIIKTIELLEANEYDVLHKMYVQQMDYADIQVEMCKSYSWVTSVHGRGLANVQKILNGRAENGN